MVMREQVPCRLSARVFLGVGLLALLAIPAWTLGQDRTPVSARPEAPATSGAKTPPAVTTTSAPEAGKAVEVGALPRTGDKKPAEAGPRMSERERRLQELEAKVEALLRELHALRGGGKGGWAKPGTVTGETPKTASSPYGKTPTTTAPYSAAAGYPAYTAMGAAMKGGKAPREMTLSRVTYELPAAKAESVAKFLRENVKASVLETRAEEEGLVVTTTPEIQHTIAQLVDLVQGKTPVPGRNYYRPSGGYVPSTK